MRLTFRKYYTGFRKIKADTKLLHTAWFN